MRDSQNLCGKVRPFSENPTKNQHKDKSKKDAKQTWNEFMR